MESMSGYFRSLKRHLNCPKAIRQPFLVKTRQLAEDFMRGKPDATSQEVIDYLGDPQELAQGFLETLEPGVLEQHKRKKKFLLCGCVSVILVALLIVTIWCVVLRNQPVNVEMIDTIIVYS